MKTWMGAIRHPSTDRPFVSSITVRQNTKSLRLHQAYDSFSQTQNGEALRKPRRQISLAAPKGVSLSNDRIFLRLARQIAGAPLASLLASVHSLLLLAAELGAVVGIMAATLDRHGIDEPEAFTALSRFYRELKLKKDALAWQLVAAMLSNLAIDLKSIDVKQRISAERLELLQDGTARPFGALRIALEGDNRPGLPDNCTIGKVDKIRMVLT